VTTYADAGVHLDDARRVTDRLAAIVGASRGPGVLADVGAFGGMFALGRGQDLGDPVLVASTDGVGTKVKIAAALGRYGTVGLDIVNHCIDDIAVQGARPLFFLDYLALHRADPDIVAAVVGGVAAACREAGIALLGGETAEMPDVYAAGEFDLAGFVVGVIDRAAIGRTGEPTAGDALVGLPSSGLHTNGYSLARRVLPPDTWHDEEPALGCTVGEALLAPHRLYLRDIETLTALGARGFAHITGGGFADNLARVLPVGTAAEIDADAWEPLPIFRLIADRGRVPRDELYRVFNMGIGLVAAVPADRAEAVLAGVAGAARIGRVVERGVGGAVRLRGGYGACAERPA
jgi:phosphoribosylformylglycinamidine cyclo-ligase